MDPNATPAAPGLATGQKQMLPPQPPQQPQRPPKPCRESSGPRVILFRAGSSDSLLQDPSAEAGVVVFNPNAFNSTSTILASSPQLDPWRADITMPLTREAEDEIPISTLQHVPRPKVQFESLQTVDEPNDGIASPNAPPPLSPTPQEFTSATSMLRPMATTQQSVSGSSTSTVTRFKSSPRQPRATVFSSTSVASAFSFQSSSMQGPPKPGSQEGLPPSTRRQRLHPNTKFPPPPLPTPRTTENDLSALLALPVPLQQSANCTDQTPLNKSGHLGQLEHASGGTPSTNDAASGLGTHYCDSETADPMPNSTPWERLLRIAYHRIGLPVVAALTMVWHAIVKLFWTWAWTAQVRNSSSWLWKLMLVVERLVSVSTVILCPLMLAFPCDFPPWLSPYWGFMDALKVLVLALHLFRPVVDKYGCVVTDMRQHLMLYLKHRRRQVVGTFPFDWIYLRFVGEHILEPSFCNMVPVYLFSDGSESLSPSNALARLTGSIFRSRYLLGDIPIALSTFTVLRMLRLGFAYPSVKWAFKTPIALLPRNFGSIVKCLLLVVAVAHGLASIFWAVDVRLPGTNRFVDRYLVDHDGVPTSFAHRAIFSYYEGQKSVFLLFPKVHLLTETVMQCVELFIASLTFHALFGQLIPFVKSLDKDAAYEKARMHRESQSAFLRGYMASHRFTPDLQTRILLQESFDFSQHKGINVNELFNDLPRTLHHDVLRHMYWDMLAKVPMFKNADDAFRLELMKRLTTISVPARFYICKFGNTGAEMFFIRQGSCEVLPAAEDKVLAKLHEGAFFGEIALLEECKRTATIRTATNAQLCVLSKSDFTSIMMSYPATAYAIHEAALERRRADAERKKLEQEAAAAAAATERRSRTLSFRNSTASGFHSAVSRIMSLSRSSSTSTVKTSAASMPDSDMAGSAPASVYQLPSAGSGSGVGGGGSTESASRPKSMTVRSPSATAISSALRRDEPWKPLVSKSRSATSPFANARVVTNTGQVNAGSLRGNILVRRPQPLPPTDTGGGGGGDGSNVGGGANGIGDGNVQGGRSGSNGSAMVVLARERKLTRSASQGGHQ